MPTPNASLKILGLAAVGLVLLAGCDRSQQTTAPTATDTPAADAHTAELAAKEQELAQREQALALKEKENDLARREAELSAQQAAAAAAAKKPAPSRPAAHTPKPSSKPLPSAPSQPAVVRVTVPTGAQLNIALSSDLSTKTARSGDAFEARLTSDVMVDGRRAVPAGTKVTGTITDVVSGSNQIGGLPTLGLRFEQLQLDDGQKIAINGELMEQGKSDTARDTAKILGGAAAGAVLGHQVKKDNRGKVIGGLLGGAIGAVAAKKTGTEVELPAGSTLTIALGAPFEVNVR